MNSLASFSVTASRRTILGLPVCDLGWSGLLEALGEQASLPAGQAVVSFLDVRAANKMAADPAVREQLSRHLVLPGSGGIDLASRVLHAASFPARMRAVTLVPALLTYVDVPKRIGLSGTDRSLLECAARALKAHAPWHEIVVIAEGDAAAAAGADRGLDILIAGSAMPAPDGRPEPTPGRHQARLVIVADSFVRSFLGAAPRAVPADPVSRLRSGLQGLRRTAEFWSAAAVDGAIFGYHLVRHRLGAGGRPVKTAAATPAHARAPRKSY